MHLLEARNITKQYAGHKALNDVSVNIPKGSIYGLLGPNGAGKTSLIRIINRITAPDSGEVFFDGRPMQPETVERIGYLPEERGLYKKMKVGEQALYLAQLKGLSSQEAKRRLQGWFERLDLTSWWDKQVDELSKGMQQKVQFIVTVLHQPELLILDEPFSGFDPINTDIIKKEILRLKDEGTTVIFSTHNMSSVEEVCDYITLINRSENILEGSVNDIRKKFRSNTYEITCSGNKIALGNSLWGGHELVNISEEDGLMKAVIKLGNNKKPNDLLGELLPNVDIVGFREIIPSMNDIFIEQVTTIQSSDETSIEERSNE